MTNPRERSKPVIASRFFAGESVESLALDYDEAKPFVHGAIREHRLTELERAVIEAARAAKGEIDYILKLANGIVDCSRAYALSAAVEALEEAEHD